MAQGSFTLFEEFAKQLGDKEHNFAADTFKVALVDETVPVPVASSVTPTWSDFSVNEVGGTNYTAGGITIPVPTYTEAGGVGTFQDDGTGFIEWIQDAAGPANIFYAILYNITHASNMAIGFIDMTSDGGSSAISLIAGNIRITWHASGIFQVTVS